MLFWTKKGKLWRFLSVMYCFFFKQKTAYEMRISDWSSDVCSSDLPAARRGDALVMQLAAHRLAHRVARREQQRHDGATPAHDARDRVRTLRQQAGEASKLGDEPRRYDPALVGVDARHPTCQDGTLPLCRHRTSEEHPSKLKSLITSTS